MPSTVKSMLGYKTLTALYSESQYNLQSPFTQNFFVNPANVDTDEYDLFVDPTDTTPAPLNKRDGSSRSIDGGTLKQRRGVLFRTFNHQAYGSDLLQALREPDSYSLDRKGRREVERQTAKFKQRHATLKELIICKIPTAGTVYWDRTSGIVAETSGTAVEDISFGVSSANQTNLGGQITANITSSSFDFWGLFAYMDYTSASNNVAPATDIWISENNKRYIRENLQFQKWAAQAGVDAQSVLRGNMVEGMFGRNWHFVGQRYTNNAGSMAQYIPDSKLIATPSPSDRSWFEAANGSTLVPTSMDIKGSVQEALNAVTEVYGPFSYAAVKHDPITVVQYAGDCFGFNLTSPDAIYQCTVTGY